MSAGDDDELFRRPGTPPSASPPVARRPRYPGSVAPAPATAPSVRVTQPRMAPSGGGTEAPLDGRIDDDVEDDGEGRGPWPLPAVVGALVAVVVAVLGGVLLLRPALSVGTAEQTAAPQPTASVAGSPAPTGTVTAPWSPGPGSVVTPGTPQSGSSGTSTSTTSTSGTSTLKSPTPAGDAAVVAQLQELRDLHLGRVRFEGQWVAQLAAKYFGVVDPLQTTASGSHTFMPADILAEYQQLRQRFGDQVVMLLGTDHNPPVTAPSGARLWVTSFTGRFRSAQEVQDWCERAYPSFSGRMLADHCVPRRFLP